jgi:hypothetical protein
MFFPKKKSLMTKISFGGNLKWGKSQMGKIANGGDR